MGTTCLTSDYSSHNKRIRDLSYCNHLCYCRRHGYALEEFECDYEPHLHTDRLIKLLAKYEFVVNIGTDVIIQKPEVPIQALCTGGAVSHRVGGKLVPYPTGTTPPCTACKERFGWPINGDFLIFHRCSEVYDMLSWLEENQRKHHDSQKCLTQLYNEGSPWFGENSLLQTAAPSINRHKDFRGVNIQDYFSIHFYTVGIPPNVDTKYRGMSEFLEQHPEYL